MFFLLFKPPLPPSTSPPFEIRRTFCIRRCGEKGGREKEKKLRSISGEKEGPAETVLRLMQGASDLVPTFSVLHTSHLVVLPGCIDGFTLSFPPVREENENALVLRETAELRGEEGVSPPIEEKTRAEYPRSLAFRLLFYSLRGCRLITYFLLVSFFYTILYVMGVLMVLMWCARMVG